MDELIDDVVEGILLRLPPADPASLVRAALVCRRWRRLISDRGFRRRFIELHRNPPTLGFFHSRTYCTRFLPTSSFRPPYTYAVPADWRATDARHGRVLYSDGGDLVVSCPMTGDTRRLPKPWPPHTSENYCHWSAAVLCPAPGCDHLDCPRGSFLVVAVVSLTREPHPSTCAYIYSSETGTWRVAASVDHPARSAVLGKPLIAAGNALYSKFFLGSRSCSVLLEYDLGKQELSFIDLPPNAPPWQWPTLLVENGGRLGIAAIMQSKLHIWLRDDTAGQNGWGWARNRVIDLMTLFPDICTATISPHLLTFVDGIDVVSVWIPSVGLGVFNLHIKSGLVTKVGEIVGYFAFLPYTCFYIPSVGRSLRAHEG
ncbi:hypothetical protein U9M48_011463 [Paspalum notatum var. saurae]|uniref:F-box domain-containing protein n=1 Tax=Paspalum notatum var. saurae TaxID=547442 RepID=A0AAQ3WHJ8_PASNO